MSSIGRGCRSPFEVRFFSRVSKTPGCWIWSSKSGASQRYPQIMWHGVTYHVHKASWIFHRGPIQDGLYVLHKCDNTRCVNPDHLFLGTAKDNAQDCLSKGRMYHAVKSFCHQGHKLDASNVYTHRNQRHCRACRREHAARFRERQAI